MRPLLIDRPHYNGFYFFVRDNGKFSSGLAYSTLFNPALYWADTQLTFAIVACGYHGVQSFRALASIHQQKANFDCTELSWSGEHLLTVFHWAYLKAAKKKWI